MGKSAGSYSISHNSRCLPTAYQGLWATLLATATSSTTAAVCPWSIRGCGQLCWERQHQLQQQLFAHGLSGAVGNSAGSYSISYNSSCLPTAYQGLLATLLAATASATTAAVCPRPIRGCGQVCWERQYQLQQQLFAHGLSGAVGNSGGSYSISYNISFFPRSIRGCGQLWLQRQHHVQQQLFAHGLSGAVGNSAASYSISYSSSCLPMAYQGLWATLLAATASATTAAVCPRPIRGCGQVCWQRQHQPQ